MGDVLTLIEEAQVKMDQKAAEKVSRRMLENKMDLNDLLDQFKQVKRMGPLKSVLSKMPGMEKQLKDVDIDDRDMDRMAAIILSMTKEERAKPSIINRPANAGLRQAAACVSRMSIAFCGSLSRRRSSSSSSVEKAEDAVSVFKR